MKETAPLKNYPSGVTNQETHFSELLDVLYKRKTFILLFCIVFISITMYRTYTLTPIYQSSVKVLIEAKSSNSPITGKRTAYESNTSQLLDMGTHFKLIKSNPVMQSVLKEYQFGENDLNTSKPGFLRKLMTQIKQNFSLLAGTNKNNSVTTGIDPAIKKKNRLVKALRGKVNVQQIKKTRLVEISVLDKNPVQAAKLANSVAQKYIEFDLSNRAQSSQKNLEWLNEELYSVKKELEDNERAFFEYKSKHQVLSIEGRQKVGQQKITEFNNRYLDARNKRLDLDSKIAAIKSHLKSTDGLIKLRSLINNNLIDTIYNRIIDLEVEQTKLSKVFKAKHPKIIQVKSEIEKNQRRLDFELSKELANLETERSIIKKREQVLQNTISEFEKDALDSSSNELTYTILQRNVITSQKIYNLLLSRIKESDILINNSISNIRIVEKAVPSHAPIAPNKRKNLLLAIFFSLIGGCSLALFFEYMNMTLRTQEEIQSYLGLPVLAVVPEAERKTGDKS